MGFVNPATGQHSWTADEAQTREIIQYGLELTQNEIDYLEELYIPMPSLV